MVSMSVPLPSSSLSSSINNNAASTASNWSNSTGDGPQQGDVRAVMAIWDSNVCCRCTNTARAKPRRKNLCALVLGRRPSAKDEKSRPQCNVVVDDGDDDDSLLRHSREVQHHLPPL
mmetsp:Transcript_4418/g.12250  ORF Transcript_4418/g.12250 Transcript_4418/m.12250 type:complete len:117 (+) Transcript_4418:1105-1455(+)